MRTIVLAPYSRTVRTDYMQYGAQRPSDPESADFSTGYGNFSSMENEEYGTPRAQI